MRLQSIMLTAAAVVAAAFSATGMAAPPEGFRAIFNGKDLTGWHGMPHFDPRDLAKMPKEMRDQKIAEWTEDAKKHWTIDKDELVNDGNGAYLTTDKDFGDIEFLIEYKTVAKADSGIYLRGCPQVQIWDKNQVFDPAKPDRKPHLGSGGLFNNTPNTPGRDPLVRLDLLQITPLRAGLVTALSMQLVLMGVFFANPGAVRMEHMLTRWMASVVGFPETSAGNLTSGGSIANLIGVVTARATMASISA